MDSEPLIPETELTFDGVKLHSCVDVSIPESFKLYGEVTLRGTIQGVEFNEKRDINIASNLARTFVQTDKYLYQPGQKVQFRILTIDGPFFKVSNAPYSEIFIESPSSSRIAQWLNVSNTGGLIHKEFQLIEEPEEGTYTINVRQSASDSLTKTTFKIEDYVLPRFEVEITPPKYILATDDILSFKVCAKYTFGQPLKGKLTGTLSNSGWGRYKVSVPIEDELFGCKDLKVNSTELQINNPRYYVYRVKLDVTVEEEGTGSTAKDSADVSITRTAVTMDNLNFVEFKKPEIPYIGKMKASFPDGSPAASELFQTCAGSHCLNITSDANGIVTFAVPPHIPDSVKVEAVNYPDLDLTDDDIAIYDFQGYVNRRYMYGSSMSTYFSKYYSPSNSSLQILPTTTDAVKCIPGGEVNLQLPVIYSAFDLTNADLNVQIVSRGQIQFNDRVPISFSPSDMPEGINLIAPMEAPSNQSIVRGVTTLSVSLPPAMSPNARILIWYTRPDGEVVPDAREIEISKCLPHQVSMTWPEAKVEQGTTQTLEIKAQPNSLCSFGIVDKSVELLAAGKDSLTLNKIFEVIGNVKPNSWDSRQINDEEYCKKKTPKEEALEPSTMPPPEAFNRKKRSSPPYFGGGYYSSRYVDAIKMFDNTGLLIISDLTYETRPCQREPGHCYDCFYTRSGGFEPVMYDDNLVFDAPPLNVPMMSAAGPQAGARMPGFAAMPAPQAAPPMNSFSVTNIEVTPTEPRAYFPETWLWELLPLESSGVYSEAHTLPDTITEWVGKAVCVHPDAGVGISAPSSITTFTPFFIDLTLLPNIKKGEIMPVVVSVFNYLETNLPVRVVLTPSTDFEILAPTGTAVAEDQTAAGTFTMCLPKGDKNTADLRIRPLEVGDVEMIFTATVDSSVTDCEVTGSLPSKTDTIVKPMTVEFEGFPREKTWTKYVCSEDIHENEDHVAEWKLEAPQNIVPESARSWITVVGDLLGPTLENLGNLIRMPYGCGEQNMLNFAPNIYVLQYLEASNQINEPTRAKLVRFMTSGYQRELKYKHSNGAYSAFGSSDDSGSTWLTAFVVKSYAQSRSYIEIDPTELSMSSDWLRNTQLENGCFESRGKVLHKGMKGGISDSKPKLLTAYVMAALLDAGEDPSSEAITNAIFCLKGKDSLTTGSDPYEMALIAHALALAKHPDTASVISSLISMASNTPSGMYWDILTSDGKKPTSTSPLAVETAGYVLMAMMESDPDLYMSQGHNIVKWISEQRNSQGGFISTQDTVIALQAMAIYESFQGQEPLNMNVDFKGIDFSTSFLVQESNKLLNQRADVPTIPTNLFASASGTGCFLMQGVVRYNVFDGEPSEAFTLSITTSNVPDKCKTRKINVCSSYLLRDGKSNMAVVEVKLVSGYIPEKSSLKQAVGYGTGLIKRYEVDGNKVLFYIDELSARETCVEFEVTEEKKVEEAKAGTVKVYDYYEPEFSVSDKYEFSRRYCRPPTPIVIDPPIIDDIIVDPVEDNFVPPTLSPF